MSTIPAPRCTCAPGSMPCPACRAWSKTHPMARQDPQVPLHRGHDVAKRRAQIVQRLARDIQELAAAQAVGDVAAVRRVQGRVRHTRHRLRLLGVKKNIPKETRDAPHG